MKFHKSTHIKSAQKLIPALIGMALAQPAFASFSADGGVVSGDKDIAIGQGAEVSGSVNGFSNGIAIGAGAKANSGSAVAIGRNTYSQSLNSVSLGADISNAGIRAVAIGSDITIGSRSGDTIALGARVSIGSDTGGAVTLGGNIGMRAQGAVAIGFGSTVTDYAEQSLALGSNAQVTGKHNIALGSNALADGSRNGNAAYLTSEIAGGELNIANGSNNRRITGVAGGEIDSDAANVGQLKEAVAGFSAATVDPLGNSTAAALGGGAQYDSTTAQISAPNYSIQGSIHHNVGDALTVLDTQVTANSNDISQIQTDVSNIDNRVTTNEGDISNIQNTVNNISIGAIGLVKQDSGSLNITVAADTGGTSVNFAGKSGNRVLSGIANGAVTQNSSEAVNGSQLWQAEQRIGTNEQNIADIQTDVSNIDNRVTTNEGDISNIQNTVNNISTGAIGLVKQDSGSLNITIAADTGGTSVNFAGKSGNRVLSGVANGAVTQNSSEAVNGSQLWQTEQRIGTNERNIADIQTDVSNIDNRVTTNEGDISNIQNTVNNISAGAIGLVKQDSGSLNITVAADTGGKVVSINGKDGERTLTGVAAGKVTQNSTEAINGSQLWQSEQNLTALINSSTQGNTQAVADLSGKLGKQGDSTATALGGGSSYDSRTGQISAPNYTVQGKNHNNVGSALSAVDKQITQNTQTISSLDKRVTQTEGNITVIQNKVTHIDNRLSSAETTLIQHSTDINQLQTAVAEKGIGLVRQDTKTGEIKVAAETGGKAVNISGKDGERALTGVAAGSAPNDAVNKAQLDGLAAQASGSLNSLNRKIETNRKHASQGIAAAMAMNIEYPNQQPNQWAMGLGLGQYDGQAALAAGVNYLNQTGKVKVYGGFGQSLNSGSRPAAKIGFGFVF